MNMQQQQQRSHASSVPAAERRRIALEEARANCRRGVHTMQALLRPNEEVCTICGLWTYCPVCLDAVSEPAPRSLRAHPVLCRAHQPQEVTP